MEHVRITLTLLRKLDACEGQRDIFRTTFPRGVTLTPEVSDAVVDKVVASTLHVDWLASEVLTDPAYAEYWRVRSAALAECWRVRDVAWAEYRRVHDKAEFRRVLDEALAEYERVRMRAAWRLLADRANWRDV